MGTTHVTRETETTFVVPFVVSTFLTVRPDLIVGEGRVRCRSVRVYTELAGPNPVFGPYLHSTISTTGVNNRTHGGTVR